MTDKSVNGYEYITRGSGTVTAKGYLQNKAASRNGMSSIESAGEGYHKGHLIAARANGAAMEENVFSQDAGLNQGAYKKVENAEMRLVQKDSALVFTEKTAFISNRNEGLPRPDAYMINDTIFYPNGDLNTVHLSFANISASDQEVLNGESDFVAFDNDMENPEDTLRDRMTEDEYTKLMEETDNELLNLGEEYAKYIENSYLNIDLSLKDMTIGESESIENGNMDNGINEYGQVADNNASNDMDNSMGDMDIGGE